MATSVNDLQALTFSPASQGKTALEKYVADLAVAAKRGNKDAAFRLGIGHFRGYFGLAVNLQKAREYLDIALINKRDNESEADSDIRMSAEKFGSKNANLLGEQYAYTQIGDKKFPITGSYEKLYYLPSIFLSVESIYLGISDASQQIGQLNAEDPARAQRSHQSVAERAKKCSDGNFIPARGFLGRITCEGYGVEQNVNEGIRLLKDAAEQGDGPSKLLLGEIYHKELYGVERNLKEAMKWYKSAEQQEIPGASQGVKTVKGLQHAKCVLL